jgi:drug/metabolite transporter (DMT)-like permease
MLPERIQAQIGPLLIAAAALLWATDSVVRAYAVSALDPTFIVLCEHWVGVLILAPWIFFRYGRLAFKLSFRDWVSLAFIGAGASATATVFFTRSFQNIHPSVAILLQKIQPIFVVIFASAFLGEKPKSRFFLWSLIALIAAAGVSFPGYNLSFLRSGFNPTSLGVAQALAAASLWAVATVMGRALLSHLKADLTSFWRFFFGWMAMLIFWVNRAPTSSVTSIQSSLILSLLYMGIFPGAVAMLLYYRGLAKTPASVATFVELVFPISAVCLNAIFLRAPLATSQLLAGGVLIFAITRISFLRR